MNTPTYPAGQAVIVRTTHHGDVAATIYDDRGDTVRVRFNTRNVYVYPKASVRAA